jgi:adenylate cyclase
VDIQRYIRYALSLALTAVLLMHIGGILPLPLLDTLENLSYDARLKLMLETAPEKHVVIIDIDEYSLDEIGHWPWKRDIIASINDSLFDYYRIKAIGFDIVFAEADEDEGAKLLQRMADGPLKDNTAFQLEYSRALNILQRDNIFSTSLKNRKTILGFVMDTNTHKGILPVPAAKLDSSLIGRIPFIKPEGYTANLGILQASASGGGFFDNPLLDDDGVYRRVPLLQEYEGKLYESLALALVRTALDSPELELIVISSPEDNTGLLLEGLKIGELVIPVDEHAGALIPYLGLKNSFTYISATDVLEKKAPVEDLTGKIALFGASAPGLLDLRTTPLQAAFPGVEIQANLIQGILDQSMLHQPAYSTAFEFILVLVVGLGLSFLLPLLSPLWGLLATSTLLLLLIGGNLIVWRNYQLVLPVAAPVLIVVVMFTLHMTYGYFVEARGKRQLARLFGQYVPPELVDEMSKKMQAVNLDGEIREMSVLFSDVHNFTTISESMEPEQLTQFINGFLTPITEIIHHQCGTIDKYMGDAVMAFWGAPLQDTRHALHALAAAMEMIQRINDLQPEFDARGWPEIKIGIGVNSGEMNVGNKGSEFRVDYTVLGDAVNLGSRLENLTRVYDVDIIVGENTRNAVAEFEFRELDRVRVKGRNKPLAIYEPVGTIGSIDQNTCVELKRFHLGLEHYRERRWDDAEEVISALSRTHPQKMLYRIYLDRIARFRKQPPPDDWDGSYSHTSK